MIPKEVQAAEGMMGMVGIRGLLGSWGYVMPREVHADDGMSGKEGARLLGVVWVPFGSARTPVT